MKSSVKTKQATPALFPARTPAQLGDTSGQHPLVDGSRTGCLHHSSSAKPKGTSCLLEKQAVAAFWFCTTELQAQLPSCLFIASWRLVPTASTKIRTGSFSVKSEAMVPNYTWQVSKHIMKGSSVKMWPLIKYLWTGVARLPLRSVTGKSTSRKRVDLSVPATVPGVMETHVPDVNVSRVPGCRGVTVKIDRQIRRGWSRQSGCQPVNLSGLLRQRPAYPPSARRTWNEKRRNNYKNGCKIFRMACTQTVLRNITNKHWSNIDPTLAHWICWVVGLMLYHRYLHKSLV